MVKCKVLVIGSINIDHSIYVDEFVKNGQTKKSLEMSISYGGKGANQAIACHNTHSDVVLFGAVGNDQNGMQFVKYLDTIKIKHSLMNTNRVTGSAFIEINQAGENRITLVPGANYEITVNDIDSVFHKYDFEYLLLQNELPKHITEYTIRQANHRKITIIYNPAPVDTISTDLLSMIDFFIPNQEEMEFYLNNLHCSSIDELIIKYNMKHIIVTMGKSGASYYSRDKSFTINGKEVDVLDTVGAGDCFIGTFCGALTLGYSIEDSIMYANHAASISVIRKGASVSYPSYDEIFVAIK